MELQGALHCGLRRAFVRLCKDPFEKFYNNSLKRFNKDSVMVLGLGWRLL